MKKVVIKDACSNSVGNWERYEDDIILRYVYNKANQNENMMWRFLND